MYVNFPRTHYWVARREVGSYVAWQWQQAKQSGHLIRGLLRAFWAPTPHRSLPRHMWWAVDHARAIGVLPGWVRFPTSGTRLQIYDCRGRCIAKVHKDSVLPNTIPSELKARRSAGSLAPAILSVSTDRLAFAEEWLPGRAVSYELDAAVMAIRNLREHVYTVEDVDAVKYGCLLADFDAGFGKWEPLLTLLVAEWPERSFPVGQVHGDLVAANLWRHPSGSLRLLDWEYSRRCLVTQDCWFYVYHHYRLGKDPGPLPRAFSQDLQYILEQAGFGDLADRIPLLHALHLIERLILVETLNPSASHSYQMLRRDLFESLSPAVLERLRFTG